ncbi:MAG: FAD-dependent oxidoreductase [Chitinophagaceae bacterium]
MQVSTLIIGSGLCGTWLAYFLEQAGISFMVLDHSEKPAASAIASGIINPVTGRRLVKTWMIDEVMPFAVAAYQNFSAGSQPAPADPFIRQCPVLDFFSAPDVEVAFKKRLDENADYLVSVTDTNKWRSWFHFDFGAGEIAPCYLVDVNGWLGKWRQHLETNQLLINEVFKEEQLLLTADCIRYGEVEAKKVIYCDGIASAQSSYFNRLPFAPNKGEALIAAIPGLPATHIFKRGMSLVPWKPGQYWIGSTYQWKFEDALPTEIFRHQATNWLQSFCKLPFEIVDHLAAVRPATIERRPFIGFHPLHQQVGIFNGMGTKGVSLAPYFARQLADLLSQQQPLMGEVDIGRFAKILSR